MLDRLSGEGYRVHGSDSGSSGATGAGVASALFGIGGGIIKVPVMHVGMGVPLPVATATSNLMIGITASVGALVYLVHGEIDPYLAGPTAIGVFVGATRRLADRAPDRPARSSASCSSRSSATRRSRCCSRRSGERDDPGGGPVRASVRVGDRPTPDRDDLRLGRLPRHRSGASWRQPGSDRSTAGPALDPGSLVAGLVGLDPAAFLWLGLGVVIATPIVRVVATGIAYARQGQWTMVLVSGAILVVIAIGVAGALELGGLMDLVVLVIAFLIILLGAELFTNGIEWFGRKLELAEGAVGSVLAAVGTALPETMIPIIAILFASGEASHAVGIGAILGAPFMLATLAMFVTGIAVLTVSRRRSTGDTMQVDTKVLAHDMRYFAIAYALAIGAAFLPLEPVWLKWIVAVVLIGIYAWYVKGHFEADPTWTWRTSRRSGSTASTGGAHRADPTVPRLRVVNLQVLVALGLIVLGAVFFVDAVEHLASHAGRGRGPARAGHRPDRHGAAREVQLDHLGPARARTRSRWATSPARWSSSRRSRPWSRSCSRRAPGSSAPGSRHRVRLGRDRVPRVGGDLHPDGPVRAAARAGPAASAGCSTWSYLTLVIAAIAGVVRGRRLRPGGPLLYSPARIRPSPAAPRRAPRRSRPAC